MFRINTQALVSDFKIQPTIIFHFFQWWFGKARVSNDILWRNEKTFNLTDIKYLVLTNFALYLFAHFWLYLITIIMLSILTSIRHTTSGQFFHCVLCRRNPPQNVLKNPGCKFTTSYLEELLGIEILCPYNFQILGHLSRSHILLYDYFTNQRSLTTIFKLYEPKNLISSKSK